MIAEDPELLNAIQRVRQGDIDSFKYIFDKFYPLLLNFFYTTLTKRFYPIHSEAINEAQDLTKDVLLQAYKELDTLSEPEKIFGWVFAIARNERNSTYLKLKRRWAKAEFHRISELGEVGESREPHANPVTKQLFNELREIVKNAIADMPPQMRLICRFRFLDELKPSEILDLVKAEKVSTVNTHIKVGKKRIQQALRNYLGEEDYGRLIQ